MPIEHEAKILNIDPGATERLILDKGGQKLGERFMRRYGERAPGTWNTSLCVSTDSPTPSGPR